MSAIVDPIQSVKSLMEIADESNRKLLSATEIIRNQNKMVNIALDVLIPLAEGGNVEAGKAVLQMQAIHKTTRYE